MHSVHAARTRNARANALSAALLVALCVASAAQAQEDIASAETPAQHLALTTAASGAPGLLLGASDFSADMFTGSGTAAPGTYELDIHFNNQWAERRSLQLRADADGEIQPCLSREILAGWGVDLSKVDAAIASGDLDGLAMPEGEFCDDLEDYIPGASVISNAALLRIEVTVPHMYALRVARDWVSPSQWDDGITAGLLNYNFTAYRTENSGVAHQAGSLTINAGFNAGPWRLRHDGAARWSEQQGLSYTAGNTYLQRDIRRLEAQLQLGEVYSRSDLFSSIAFTGAQLYSDERMLPQSQRGFAPTVRGVANGNSRVSIYQQGHLIHEVNVANGPFEIDDLYASAYGGDLEVVVTAANGSEQRFSQSYAAVPQLLRPGQNRFSAAAGQVRSWNGEASPYLLEGTWRHGINNAVTGYGGLRASDGYQAAVLGAAINLPIGALATDVTVSRSAQPGGDSLRGQSYRVTYSKELFKRSTNLSLAAYRYSTEHFRDLSDHIRDNAQQSGVIIEPAGYRQRSRFDVNLSQRLPAGWGNLWVSGNTTSYWDRAQTQTSYSVGYNNHIGNLTIGLNARRSQTRYNGVTGTDTQFGLSLSMPLGTSRSIQAPRLTLDANHSATADSYRAGVSGGVGEAFNYGASLSHEGSNGGLGLSGNANYRTPYADFSGFYTRSDRLQTYSVGMQGGLVVHGGGITLGAQMGDTIALVKAEGAAGAKINHDVARVDRRGYAVVGNINPYRLNPFNLNPEGVGDEISILSGAVPVAPTLGAVVPVVFRTEKATSARLLLGTHADGTALPFGTTVADPDGQVVGMVGQGGQMWLTFKTEDTPYVTVNGAQGVLRCDLPESEGDAVATVSCTP